MARRLLSCSLIGCLIFSWTSSLFAQPLQWPVDSYIIDQSSKFIETQLKKTGPINLDGYKLTQPSQVLRFYQENNFMPVWVTKDGVSLDSAELLQAVKHCSDEGLLSKDYPVEKLEDYLLNALDGPRSLANLDVLLTDTFLHYGSIVRSGRFSPRRVNKDWSLPYHRFDATGLLLEAVAHHDLNKILSELPPSHAGYRSLRMVLKRYHEIAESGGWGAIDKGETLGIGSQGEQVLQLRKRLKITDDGVVEGTSPEQFDEQLAKEVEQFQQRHGLNVDGRVGEHTRNALNVPVEVRIRQIEANMERWRWMPEEMPEQYIAVNMAGYELDVDSTDQNVISMRVIVGRNYRQTPVFSGEITTLVFNPDWYVPPTIIREDILPQLRTNPSKLKQLGLSLLDNGEQIDANTIDWSKVDGAHFPYTLIQKPGPHNPLGHVKFLVPDSDGIYLHDTPDHRLFDQPNRALSSGCIRLEYPQALAIYLLSSQNGWDQNRIEGFFNSWQTVGLKLTKPMPIYFLYWTAWVDKQGVLQFRNDIYSRDRQLLRVWDRSVT